MKILNKQKSKVLTKNIIIIMIIIKYDLIFLISIEMQHDVFYVRFSSSKISLVHIICSTEKLDMSKQVPNK